MLAYLPPLFFFAVLMGSPVPGFLVFMLLGGLHAWQSWRQPQAVRAFQWTKQDTLLALCFMSIPLFKALTVLWSEAPVLAWKNALQHSYFLFWPLVMAGLDKSKGVSRAQIDRAIAIGLISLTLWRLIFQLTELSWLPPGNPNRGILAQLTMVLGAWNLLALTHVNNRNSRGRCLYAAAALCTFVLLINTERRLELLGFVLLTVSILIWRWRTQMTLSRLVGLLLTTAIVLGIMVYLRWELFAQGIDQLVRYLNTPAGERDLTNNSWGSRLEMWRLGWTAFLEHPILGLSASIQPSQMQAWGAQPAETFGHRHFHGQWLQILVEGGLLGAGIAVLTLAWIIRSLIVRPMAKHEELSLLGATLIGAYLIEGVASAALHYDKPNAFMVVASAWLWAQLRNSPSAQAT